MVDADIGTLRATLTVDGSEYEAGLKKAEDETTSFQNKTEDLNTSMINLASGIYVAQQAYYYATSAITMFSDSTVRAYDQVDAFNRLTGTSVQEGGKWKDMLEKTNLSLSDMTYTFRAFSNNLQTAMADPNSSASRAFKQLGIVLTDNKGQLKDNNTLMLETIAAFQKMPDGMQKTALAFDLLGRGAININKLLKEGKDIITDYGVAISNETEAGREKVEKFKLAWANYNDTIDDTKSKLGEGLIPAFTTLINFLNKSVLPVLDAIGSRFERIGYVMGAYMRFGQQVSEAKTPEEREIARQEFFTNLSGDVDQKFGEAKELSYTAPSEEKQQKRFDTLKNKLSQAQKFSKEDIDWASKYSPDLLNQYNQKVAEWKPSQTEIEIAQSKGVKPETLSPYYVKPTEGTAEKPLEWIKEKYGGTPKTPAPVPTPQPQPVVQPTPQVTPQPTVTETKEITTTERSLTETKTVKVNVVTPTVTPEVTHPTITPTVTQPKPISAETIQPAPITAEVIQPKPIVPEVKPIAPVIIPVQPLETQTIPIAEIPKQTIPIEKPLEQKIPVASIEPVKIPVEQLEPIKFEVEPITALEQPTTPPGYIGEMFKDTNPEETADFWASVSKSVGDAINNIEETLSKKPAGDIPKLFEDTNKKLNPIGAEAKEQEITVKTVEPVEIPVKKVDEVKIPVQDVQPVTIPVKKPDEIILDVKKPEPTTVDVIDKTGKSVVGETIVIPVSVETKKPIAIDTTNIQLQKQKEPKSPEIIGYKEGLMNVPIYKKPEVTFEQAQDKIWEYEEHPPVAVPTQPQLQPQPVTQPKEPPVLLNAGAEVKTLKTPTEEINTRLTQIQELERSAGTYQILGDEQSFTATQTKIGIIADEVGGIIEKIGSPELKNMWKEIARSIDDPIKSVGLLDGAIAKTMTNAKDATEKYKDSIKDLDKLKKDALKSDRDYYENIQRAGRDVGQIRDLTIAWKRTKRDQAETFTESTQRAQEAGAGMIQAGGNVSKDTWNVTITASKDYPIDKIIADLNTYQESQRRSQGIPTR